jgi:hypothetical protein
LLGSVLWARRSSKWIPTFVLSQEVKVTGFGVPDTISHVVCCGLWSCAKYDVWCDTWFIVALSSIVTGVLVGDVRGFKAVPQ